MVKYGALDPPDERSPWESWFAWYPVWTAAGERLWLRRTQRRWLTRQRARIRDYRLLRVPDWRDADAYSPLWDARAAAAAQLVPAGTSVLDLGCGPRQALRTLLPAGCRYFPADMTKWNDETILVDLDKGEYPEGRHDVTVALGVLCYLHDPARVLRQAALRSSTLIVSFTHPRLWESRRGRQRRGWINHYSHAEFCRLLNSAGWTVVEEHRDESPLRHRTIIYRAQISV